MFVRATAARRELERAKRYNVALRVAHEDLDCQRGNGTYGQDEHDRRRRDDRVAEVVRARKDGSEEAQQRRSRVLPTSISKRPPRKKARTQRRSSTVRSAR